MIDGSGLKPPALSTPCVLARSCSKTCPACSQPTEKLFDAYAAGLIDGEGWIGALVRTGPTSPAHRCLASVQVEMATRALPILTALQRHYGGSLKLNRSKSNDQSSTAAWRVFGESVACVLRRLRPFLRMKTEQADLLIATASDISLERNANGRWQWSAARITRWETTARRLSELNAKGQRLPDPAAFAELAGDRWVTRTVDLFGERWETFSGPWPSAGMTRNGLAYARPMSARRIAADASSLWLTPSQSPSSSINNGSEAGKPSTGKSLQRQATGEWATPQTSDSNGARTFDGKRGIGLNTQATLWPTPNVQDAESAARHTTTTGVMHPGTTLTDAVRDEWTTPTRRDRETLAKVTRGAQAMQGGTPLLVQVTQQDWRTPQARDWKGTSQKPWHRGGGSITDQLAAMRETWPTPQGYAAPSGMGQPTWTPLDTAVRGSDGPPDPATYKRGGNLRACSVVLSPAWVSILMGFPPDWCDIGDVPLPRSATPSCRSRRPSSPTSCDADSPKRTNDEA